MLAFSDVYGDDFHVPGWLAFMHFTHFILTEGDIEGPFDGDLLSLHLKSFFRAGQVRHVHTYTFTHAHTCTNTHRIVQHPAWR